MDNQQCDIPDDATGDALRRMLNDGADFSKPHEIDFHVAAPSEISANSIAKEIALLEFKVKAVKDEDGPNWTCWCTTSMCPNHADITRIENELDTIAKKFGGWIDGWGAFTVE